MDPAIQDAIRQRMKEKRKAKKASRYDDGSGNLNMNSMMDMMTIILVFLLKSYGEETIKITNETDVPWSISDTSPTDTITVTISQTGLFVNDTRVVDLDADGMVEAQYKKGGIEGMFISPLEAEMREIIEKLGEDKFTGELTIVADAGARYRTITEVMRTAIAVKFKEFRFAVIKIDKMRQVGYSKSNPPPE